MINALVDLVLSTSDGDNVGVFQESNVDLEREKITLIFPTAVMSSGGSGSHTCSQRRLKPTSEGKQHVPGSRS